MKKALDKAAEMLPAATHVPGRNQDPPTLQSQRQDTAFSAQTVRGMGVCQAYGATLAILRSRRCGVLGWWHSMRFVTELASGGLLLRDVRA
eukprot:952053-Rhodomonas_salina.1